MYSIGSDPIPDLRAENRRPKSTKLSKVSFVLLLIVTMALTSETHCITVSIESDAGGLTEEFSGGIVEGKTIIMDSGIFNSLTGSGNLKEKHWVSNKDRAFAEVGVDIRKAKDYQYSYALSPGDGAGWLDSSVQAEEALNINSAEYAKAYANARNSQAHEVAVSIEVTQGSLSNYFNRASASSDMISVSQNFDIASAEDIRMESSSFLLDSPAIPGGNAEGLEGIPQAQVITSSTGRVTNYVDSVYRTSSLTNIQQQGHIAGTFTSTATADVASISRASNGGSEYDLSMQAMIKDGSPAVSGVVGYYVTPKWTIQGAIDAANSGDTINVATGKYEEDVNFYKSLYMKGDGDPTANSFSLTNSALLGDGSEGITAPIVNVNLGSRIKDGITLASNSGVVNVDPGTYEDNLDQSFYDRKIQLVGQDAVVSSISLDKPVTDSSIGYTGISGIKSSNIAVNPGAKIQDGINLAVEEGAVNIAEGTYTEHGIQIDKSLILQGEGIDNTIIDAQHAGRVFYILPSVDVTMKGMTIQKGGMNYWGDTELGGSIWNYGSLTMQNCLVQDSIARLGAGILNAGGAIATIKDSTIRNNVAMDGGAIANSGGGAVLTLDNCLIYGNTAYMGSGAIHNNAGITNINSGRIYENSALWGGAIRNQGYGVVNLNGGSIDTNSAIGGGAILNWQDGIVNIIGGEISRNSASGGGGILNLGPRGTVNLYGGAVTQNTATDSGAGIHNSNAAGYTGNVINGDFGLVYANTLSSGEIEDIYWEG